MQLYDRNNIRIVNEFNIAEDTPKDNDWVSVSVSSGSSYGTAPYPYDIGLKNDTEYPSVADIPYHFTGERQYGLDLYTVPGINRDTGVFMERISTCRRYFCQIFFRRALLKPILDVPITKFLLHHVIIVLFSPKP